MAIERARPRPPASGRTGAARCSRSARRCALDKGRGIARAARRQPGIDAALYVGDDLTDLDAFAALRALRDEGALTTALCVGVASDETPPRAGGERRPRSSTGPPASAAMLSTLAA